MDLRAERTKKSIWEAFLKLRKKKSIEKITVREISDIAMINKSTFYRYYEDIYRLSDEIENYVLDKCLKGIDNFIITDTIERFIDNSDLFNVVFSGDRMDIAINKLHDRAMEIILKSNPKLENDLEKKVIISSLIFGNFKAYTFYQNEDLDTVYKGIQTLTDLFKYIVF